jgi:repressor LexA
MNTSLIIRASRTRLIDFEPESFHSVENDSLQAIPLLGTVSAGQPIDIYEEAEELEIPAAWVSKNTFALRVRGDSMVDDQIQDGDIIIVEQRTYADNGETVVACINGEQATLKKLYVEKDHIRLQPANPAMKPMILRHADVEVMGIVKVIVRRT